MAIRRSKTVNYLSNKELLKEIHKSKNSYSQFDDKKYEMYDIIIDNLDNITEEIIQKAKENRANRINNEIGDKLYLDGMTKKQLSEHMKEHEIKSESIKEEDLVFRLMCDDHIPNVKNKKGETVRAKVNFPPFQHHILKDGQFKCVGKSHHKNGEFSKEHGEISRNLATGFLKLTDKYGKKSNWRGYNWLEEMKGYAIVRLCQVALQFNEAKSQNPFAWYTTVINRSFTHILNGEKKNLDFKNRLNSDQGMEATFLDQAEHEIESYYKNIGTDNPYKKIITNKPLGFYKKKAEAEALLATQIIPEEIDLDSINIELEPEIELEIEEEFPQEDEED